MLAGEKWKNFDCPIKYTITFVKELLAMKKLQRDMMKVVWFLKSLSGQDLVNRFCKARKNLIHTDPLIYVTSLVELYVAKHPFNTK